jgi:hypothetical protein
MLCVWAANIFLTCKFSYLLFSNPTLKLGLQVGGRVLVPTHMNQSNYLANHQHCYALLCLLPSQQTVHKCWAKIILLCQTSKFDHSSSHNFELARSHTEHSWSFSKYVKNEAIYPGCEGVQKITLHLFHKACALATKLAPLAVCMWDMKVRKEVKMTCQIMRQLSWHCRMLMWKLMWMLAWLQM